MGFMSPIYSVYTPSYYNLLNYCYGDGVNDDTTNIQNLFNSLSSGGIVFVPFAKFLISRPLIIDTSNITIIGLGYYGASTFLTSSADPSYALIVGQNNFVSNIKIDGVTFQGRSSITSTGAGIKFGGNTSSIKNSWITGFGSTGCYVNGNAGQIFQVYMEDAYFQNNGFNTTGTIQQRTNLYIDSQVANCEYIRCISSGNQGLTTTQEGIYIASAADQKFVDCHTFFCSGDGLFINFGDGLQIQGGEYENCAVGMNINHINRGFVQGAQFYGNTSGDIGTFNNNGFHIIGCGLVSTGIKNINTYSSNYSIDSCTITSTVKAIEINSGSNVIIHDNILTHVGGTLIDIFSNNCIIHDNVCQGNVNDNGSNNIIHDNNFASGTIGVLGATSVARNNIGYNPKGHFTSPGIPATGITFTNPFGVDCMVIITGGVVTAIAIGGTATGQTSGTFRIPALQTVTLTYTSPPAWTWYGD